MGGYGSGEWRSARYARVEDCCVLGAAWLRSRGAIRAGCMVTGTASWTRRPSGELAASIWWEADLRDPAAPCVWLRYRAGAARVDEAVPLHRTAPNYGGTRWWFGCPRCGRRSATLYLPPGAERFRCRRCYRLAYQCQRETAPDRMLRRAHKLRARIGCAPGELPRMSQKPKWMRKRTYWRIRDEAESWDAAGLCLGFARLLPAHPLSAEIRRQEARWRAARGR